MGKSGKAAKRLAEMDPFFREQFVARRIYSELMELDKPSRRRVLGIVNDYAMTADKKRELAPKEEGAPPFVLDDEVETS